MKKIAEALNQHLDHANFEALIANAKKADLTELALTATDHVEVKRILGYAKSHPDAEFVQANAELVAKNGKVETWAAFGNANMSSFIWWALGGGVAFPGEAPLAFLFGASGGPDWALSTFTSVIGGSFVVDPKMIVKSAEFKLEKSPIGWVKKGPCRFTLSEGGVGAGEVNISFYSMSGTYWGTLSGVAGGIGGAGVHGEAELVWQGF